jgi:hypothetical protein
MENKHTNYHRVIRRNIAGYKAWRNLTHQQLSQRLSELTGCTTNLTMSAAMIQRQTHFSACKLSALAEIFGTEVQNLWMEAPPDLPPAYYLPGLVKNLEGKDGH